jgi:hypothetical protein
MSEFQYYEFQAIDRPLDAADREALRALSTRARITATSFTNSYDWGDFKGDPDSLMETWFDLHLYLANWGSRRLMIRLPKRLVDLSLLDSFLGEVDCAEIRIAGENLILDIARDELEVEDRDDDSDWDDDSDRLAAMAPLRADVLAGDPRLFYLPWLIAVEDDAFGDDEPEPMPGIGPMTGALQAFADFFAIDRDLVQAAAERPAIAMRDSMSSGAAQRVIEALGHAEKTAMLSRLYDGDPHVVAELRAMVRKRSAIAAAPPASPRTVGVLRQRARALASARERAEAEKAESERKRQAEEAEKARRSRLVAIRRRGESVWKEVASEIERRNAAGYDRAQFLLSDLRAVAEEDGALDDFLRRLHALRQQHARKEKLIERVAGLG